MADTLYIGIKGHQEKTVTEELTASHIESGAVRVFATPMMIAMMEHTCERSVKPYLEDGDDTVGIHVNVSHDSSVPVGMKVWCDSELIERDRRRLVFRVEVRCDRGLVGQGVHERFIIHTDEFLKKTYSCE